jgi:hypothetical protein
LPEEDNHLVHALEVFNRTAHKIVKDAISYACIQVNNTYYKEVLGLNMNKKLGSSAIYLTEEQYNQVKISKSFDIQYLIYFYHMTYWLHLWLGGDSVVQEPVTLGVTVTATVHLQ